MLCITGIQLSADIGLTVYSLYRARKQRDSVVFKCINISDINIEKILVFNMCLAQLQRCKLVFSATSSQNSTRFYENLSVSKLVKTAINTAIPVKLLKSKLTLLNTCEKLKMSHEHNVTFEINKPSAFLGCRRPYIVLAVSFNFKLYNIITEIMPCHYNIIWGNK
jgi:hypothetical protein